jgi:hypothetical protein
MIFMNFLSDIREFGHIAYADPTGRSFTARMLQNDIICLICMFNMILENLIRLGLICIGNLMEKALQHRSQSKIS